MMFVLRMAARETRSSWRRLLFFFVCIAVGVAAIVTLRSVIQSVRAVFGTEAKSLIAADVVISTTRDWSAEARATIDRRLAEAGNAQKTETLETPTMVRPADTTRQVAKMAELRAVEAGFPPYGAMELADGQPYSHALLEHQGALVRPELLTALNVKVGDQIAIGQALFTIRGLITKEPGSGMGDFSLGPRVLIDLADIPATALLSFGSRARHVLLVKAPDDRVDGLVRAIRRDFREDFITARSYRSNEDQIGRDFDRAENYLSLVGLVIVILGGIAVSSVTRVFILQKIRSIAVLKCVGARSGQIIGVYILQVMTLGLAGSLLGVAMSRVLLAAIPAALGSSTSILAQAHYGVSLSAAFQGTAIGVLVSLLFSVVPLMQVRFIKPSLLLRDETIRRATRLDRHSGHCRGDRCAGGAHRLAGGVAQGGHHRVCRICRGGRRPDAGRARPDRADRAARPDAIVSAASRRSAPVAARQPDARHPPGRGTRCLLHRRRAIAAGEPAWRVFGPGRRGFAGHVPARHPEGAGRRRARVPGRPRAPAPASTS